MRNHELAIVRALMEEWVGFDDNIEADKMTAVIDHMRNYAQQFITNAVNRRMFTAVIDNASWRHRYKRNDFEDGQGISQQPEDLQAIITPSQDDVRKAVLTHMTQMAGLVADKRIPYPQFPETMPRTFYYGNPQADLDNETYSKLISRKGVIY